MTDNTTRTNDSGREPRLIAGQYELWRRIDDGRGGMGIVYEAFDHKLQQRVALKCPKQEMWEAMRARQRLIDEARLQAQLKRHPHIVFVQNFHDEGLGRPIWLVMEFIEGWTLDTVIDEKGQQPVAAAAAVALQIADALEYANERGIVHRDIKPSNIMVDRNGWAWVMDFGIARLVKQTVFTLTGHETTGTPLYMAPEQYTGGKAARDKRVDIFAFGAVLYEMLAAEPTFRDAADPRAAKEAQVRIPLAEHRDDVPPGLLELVDACLRARQDERPPDFAAVKDALREAVPDLDLPSGPARATEPQKPERPVEPASIRVEARTVADDADLMLIRLRGSGLGEEFLHQRRAEAVSDALISEFVINAAGRGFTRLSYEQIKDYLTDALKTYRERSVGAAWDALAEASRALEAGDVDRAKELADIECPSEPKHLADAFARLKDRIEHAGRPSSAPAQTAIPDWARVAEFQIDYAREHDLPVAREIDLGKAVTMRFVLIPPGRFLMGSPITKVRKSREVKEGLLFKKTRTEYYETEVVDGDKGLEEETPQHEVTITKPFYMGVTQVTQAQYEAVMGNNLSKDNPVESVSWNDATEFCRKLSRMAGEEIDLPTEAQWEYACRAGSTTTYCFGDSDNQLGDYAWYNSNSRSRTHPVGQKKPNPWGLHDMHGNVWEWCRDWYDKDYYAQSPKQDPEGPQTGSDRVLRGGSWLSSPYSCRSAYRYRYRPTDSNRYVGFRVCVRASSLARP